MSSIIHPKIIALLLILASISFAIGIAAFAIAVSSQQNIPSPTPIKVLNFTSDKPDVSPMPTKGELILTPVNFNAAEIKIGRDSLEVKNAVITFDLATIPTNSKINKATLRLYQKDIIGNPYLNNTIEVNDIGTISRDSKLGWKEIDVTYDISKKAEFNIHLARENKSVTKDGDFAIFEAVPQLVVDIN